MSDETTSIYLAGPVRDAPDGGKEWRERLQERFGDEYELVNPLSKYNTAVEDLRIVDGTADPNSDGVVGVDDIVREDLEMIDGCDGVLVGYINVGRMVGTPMEVMYARRVKELPVAVWMRDDTDFRDTSPWFRSLATAMTNSSELALSHIENHPEGVEW